MDTRTKAAILYLLVGCWLSFSVAQNLCFVNTCSNNGTCYIENGSDVCMCPPSYTGMTCEIEVVSGCQSTTCKNGGTCNDEDGVVRCDCLPIFTGQFCDSLLNGCDSNPCFNEATCSNFFGAFVCSCPPGFTGRQCETDNNDCASNPCADGGTCIDEVNGYTCECPPGFTGSNCSINIDDCRGSDVECHNDGECLDLVDDYYCDCTEEFGGRNCEIESDCPLDNLTQCENNGFCHRNTSSCSCITGYTGTYCETELNECDSNPCNNGTCVDKIGSFSCNCFPGYTGQQCEEVIDMCQPQPCYNGAMCVSSINGFDCFCRQGYTGQFCQVDIDECLSSPCQNGGNCTEMVNGFSCGCLPGYSGTQCEIDSCSSQPCQNDGTCIANGLTYSCVCSLDYTDENCTTFITPCYFEPCLNGATCINEDLDNYTCSCLPGFTEEDCSVNIDDCGSNPCQNEGTCIDLVNDYQCDCSAGYTGSDCQTDIDECLMTPCFNNGTCTDLVNSVSCECPPGFNGSLCQNNINECSSSPCSSGSTCIDEIDDFTCLCPMGLTGTQCDISIIDCSDMPCGNNGTCTDTPGGYECSCSSGYTGVHCMVNINDCLPHPCNNGTCIDGINEYVCICPEDYTGDNCETPIDHCDSNPCSSLATCITNPGGYQCICPIDFTGTDCFDQINDCQPNPCNNGGTCSDLIGTFNCSCPLGFEGSICEYDINECASLPCLNGGNCTDLVNGYSCSCPHGFNGTNCENSTITTCESVVCENGGMCDDTPTGFECLCPNGYTGPYCQNNIDDCLSNPCLNNATCIDEIANYTCECTEGFDGRNCAIDTDLCSPQPCFNGGTCSETSDSFFCTCPLGYFGSHCQNTLDPCSSSPCLNSGICTNVNGTNFSCACSQAYGGERCEIKLFPDCLDMPCLNNGTCAELVGSGNIGGSGAGEPGPRIYCQCPLGYAGEFCENITDLCVSSPCKNNATCIGDSANFTCTCLPGFTGTLCETELTGCHTELYPCLNGGECMEMDGQFMCNCAPGFTGPLCGYGINECRNQPCLNGGTCRDFFRYYVCICPPNFTGTDCESMIDPCTNIDCNNGSCIGDMGTYTCQCDPGWTGLQCESEINECDGVDCTNGTCVDLINNYTCQCSDGFTGQFCEINIDDCAGINCNNGTCVDGIGSYQCDCLLGYTGPSCDTIIDDCAGMPCMNNASCIDLFNNYTCVCSDGFTGRFCEVNIDDCLNINCNNGSCEDLINDHMCNCFPGFTDQRCETDINECDGNPCNDGTCTDGINSFSCSCPPDYTGDTCDTEINLCLMEQPCLNNGTCTSDKIEGIPIYNCSCSVPLYSGDNCEQINSCSLSPCQNNATCTGNLTTGDYTCHCSENYYGTHCERFDYCHSNPCQNDGTCINGSPGNLISDTFLCICMPQFNGSDCSMELSPCSIDPCMNGGTCVEDGSTRYCQCPVGYTGNNCSEVFSSDTPYFNGDSYTLVPYSPNNNNSQSLINLHFRTSSQSGLLLYISEEDHSSYLSLGIEAGLLSLRMRQEGSFIQSVARYHPVSDDRWHYVEVTQNGLEIKTEIDGYPNSTSLIDMFLIFEPAVTYIGGFDNYTSLPSAVLQSSGFIGYINATIQLGGEALHIIDDSIAGRDIAHGEAAGSCGPETCSNGGICVEESQSSFLCLCPIGFRGDTCEQDTEIIVPYFNTRSYAIVSNDAFSLYGGIDIDITLHTSSPNGLIYYLYDSTNVTNDYFTLYLEEGGIGIEYSMEGSAHIVSYQGNVSDNEWHLMTVQLNTSGLYLILDGSLVLYSNNATLSSIYLTSPLFLGGLPNGLIADSVSGSGLNGCIRDVQISNTSLGLIENNVLYGLGLLECPQSLCPLVQCLNGGTCVDSDVSVFGFECSCPSGYNGTYCEVLLSTCIPNPCLFDGVCTDFNNMTYSCQCTLGRQGRICDEELNITVPAFYGNSYLAYSSLSSITNVQSNLILSLTFKPTSPSGLLLFNGHSNTDFSQYVSISLVNSSVVYKFDLGSGLATISSPITLGLNQWHTITAYRTGRVGFLRVNDEELLTNTSLGTLNGLNIAGDMWLGGTDRFNIISQHAGVGTGLTGCISSVSVNGISINLVSSAERGLNIGECNMTSCSSFPCFNGGTCTETGSSFICQCPAGYEGGLCGLQTFSCLSSPCGNGGTCIEGVAEGGYNCLCPLGFGGNNCNEMLQVSTPSFNRTSYQEYSSPAPISLSTIISLSFHPTSSNGLILYIGDVSTTRDFLSLSLVSGRIQLRYDLGSGPAIIASPSVIPLNQWTSVTVNRVRKDGVLVVDSVSTNGSSPGFAGLLNPAGNLYIGGGAGGVGGYQVSPNAGSHVGLTGCVDTATLRVNSFGLGAVISSRGVIQCQVDPCSHSPCQNGGSCVSSDLTYSCVCPLGYSGDQCQEKGAAISQCPTSVACNVNPCLNGGKCIAVLVNGIIEERCQCSLPFAAGAKCEQRVSFSSAFFAGDGYLLFPAVNIPLSSITIHTEIRLSIIPSNGSGLLLYIGHANPSTGNYLLVGMNEGVLEFRFQLGSGVGLVETSQPLAIGQQHNITLLRTDYRGRILMSQGNTTVFTDGMSQGSSRHLNLSPYDFVLFLGGAPNVPLISQQVYQTGFSGCLVSVVQLGYSMNPEPVPFDTSSVGENVTTCS
uniref:Uncharacterized protein n=1 Tax=Amphimedon queenslandica TaxID=400682 RepID=A0A1X7UPV7_AMPQE